MSGDGRQGQSDVGTALPRLGAEDHPASLLPGHGEYLRSCSTSITVLDAKDLLPGACNILGLMGRLQQVLFLGEMQLLYKQQSRISSEWRPQALGIIIPDDLPRGLPLPISPQRCWAQGHH